MTNIFFYNDKKSLPTKKNPHRQKKILTGNKKSSPATKNPYRQFFSSHATATNNIMSEIIFIALLTNIIILAFNLYAVESNDLFSLEAIVGSLTIVGLLPLTFGYCYLAELMTSSLDDIGDIFYNSPWYELPAKQQKIVILPIQRTGREFSFQCLGLIDCSLVTFSSVWTFFLFFAYQKELRSFIGHDWHYRLLLYHLNVTMQQLIRSTCSYFIILRRFKWMRMEIRFFYGNRSVDLNEHWRTSSFIRANCLILRLNVQDYRLFLENSSFVRLEVFSINVKILSPNCWKNFYVKIQFTLVRM